MDGIDDPYWERIPRGPQPYTSAHDPAENEVADTLIVSSPLTARKLFQSPEAAEAKQKTPGQQTTNDPMTTPRKPTQARSPNGSTVKSSKRKHRSRTPSTACKPRGRSGHDVPKESEKAPEEDSRRSKRTATPKHGSEARDGKPEHASKHSGERKESPAKPISKRHRDRSESPTKSTHSKRRRDRSESPTKSTHSKRRRDRSESPTKSTPKRCRDRSESPKKSRRTPEPTPNSKLRSHASPAPTTHSASPSTTPRSKKKARYPFMGIRHVYICILN